VWQDPPWEAAAAVDLPREAAATSDPHRDAAAAASDPHRDAAAAVADTACGGGCLAQATEGSAVGGRLPAAVAERCEWRRGRRPAAAAERGKRRRGRRPAAGCGQAVFLIFF